MLASCYTTFCKPDMSLLEIDLIVNGENEKYLPGIKKENKKIGEKMPRPTNMLFLAV
jgi:hypothetical protein